MTSARFLFLAQKTNKILLILDQHDNKMSLTSLGIWLRMLASWQHYLKALCLQIRSWVFVRRRRQSSLDAKISTFSIKVLTASRSQWKTQLVASSVHQLRLPRQLLQMKMHRMPLLSLGAGVPSVRLFTRVVNQLQRVLALGLLEKCTLTIWRLDALIASTALLSLTTSALVNYLVALTVGVRARMR